MRLAVVVSLAVLALLGCGESYTVVDAKVVEKYEVPRHSTTTYINLDSGVSIPIESWSGPHWVIKICGTDAEKPDKERCTTRRLPQADWEPVKLGDSWEW